MSKKILFSCILLFSMAVGMSQVQLVSTTRIDEIKLKMTSDTLSNFFAQKIKLQPLKEEFSADTVWGNYKGDSVRLIFKRFLNEKKATETSLQNIYSTGKKLKTKSGISVGDNKFDIIKKLDGSIMRLAPDWHYENDVTNKKLYSTIVLYDYGNKSMLIFYFYNNSLYAFECAVSAEEG